MSQNNQQEALAAASLREHLQNVDLSDSSEAYPHAGLVQNDERRTILNLLSLSYDGDVTETKAYQDLLQPAGTETITDAVGAGNISQMQYAVGMVDHADESQGDAKLQVARALAREGMVILVVGPPGSGKSSLSADVVRIAATIANAAIVSNVESWDAADEHVSSDDEYWSAMASRQGQVIGWIDEASRTLTGENENQKPAREFSRDMKQQRKKWEGDRYARRGSTIVVGHTFMDTEADLRRVANMVVEKPSRPDPGRVVIYESDGGDDGREQIAEFKGVSDSPEDFSQYDPSEFVVSTDADTDADTDGRDVSDALYRADVQTAIQARMNGASVREAARQTTGGDTDDPDEHWSKSWVSDRWTEWLRGEHRDIVPMPEDKPEAVERGLNRID